MRKYSVERKALKMKMSIKEHASRVADYWETRFAEVQANYPAAEIFVRDIR